MGAAELTKNANPNTYRYSNLRFDLCWECSLPDGSMGKNVIIFEVNTSSSVHIDNKEKDVLILGKGPTLGLDDTTLTAEAHYLIAFSRSNIILLKFLL